MKNIQLTAKIDKVTVDTKYMDDFGGCYETVFFDPEKIMGATENNILSYTVGSAMKVHEGLINEAMKRQ